MPDHSMTAEYTDARVVTSQDHLNEQKSYRRSALYDVAIVGLGYVGLPTAIGFAQAGVRVHGVDVSQERLDVISSSRADLLPEDAAALSQVLGRRLSIGSDLDALSDASAVIICVPTPVDEHLTPDLDALSRACESVVARAVPGQLLLLTSTTYVGTTRDMLVEPLLRRGLRVGADVNVAFSPERIDPGNALFHHTDVPRVVGGVTPECSQRTIALLRRGGLPLHQVSSPEAAELTKLYENTFRAVNIALANEMADVSASLGVEVTEVIDAAATKPYGFMPFQPGPGVGGHCIPCDPHYLLWQLREQRLQMPVVESAMRGIAARPSQVVARCRELLAEHGMPIKGATIAIVGVAYKPGVEDVRESPALEIIERLQQLGAKVGFVDELASVIRMADGQTMTSWKADSDLAGALDLAVVHTRHPGSSLDWLSDVPAVLDATYRASELSQRTLI